MTLRAGLALVKRVPAGQGVSYGHTYMTDRGPRSAWCRWATPTASRGTAATRPGAGRRRRRTVAGRVCMDQFVLDLGDDPAGPATRSCSSAPATRASRPPRTGRRRPARSLRDRHPDRAAGAAGRTSERSVSARVEGWERGRRGAGAPRSVGAAAGVVVAGAAVGLAAERYAVGRSFRTAGDPWADEPLRRAARHRSGDRDDGGELYVEVDGPAPRARKQPPVTVVFCHGLALNQDSWHYQRRDLADLGRLVFWDQRGHGRSAGEGRDATIDQLGHDLLPSSRQRLRPGRSCSSATRWAA